MSPSKHKLSRPGEKDNSSSERARLMEEGIISKSTPKVQKLGLDNEDSIFDCYDKSEEKPVHANIDKLTSEGRESKLAILRN